MIDSTTENRFCQCCQQESKHIVVLLRKQSVFEGDKQATKEFIAGLIKGWAAGPFIAEMDDFERHCICEVCGTKVIEA